MAHLAVVADDVPLKFAPDIEAEPSPTELHLRQLHCSRHSTFVWAKGYFTAVLIREPPLVPETRIFFVTTSSATFLGRAHPPRAATTETRSNLGEMERIALRFHSNIVSSTCSR
jgi:hypothetical protein